jgi:hypothetical protein
MDFFRDFHSIQLAVSEYENEEIDKKTHTVSKYGKGVFLGHTENGENTE